MNYSKLLMNEISTFNKNEKKLISHIIQNSIHQKIAEITLEEDFIMKVTRINQDNLYKFLTKLSSKQITFNIDENNQKFDIITNIFSFMRHAQLYVFVINPIIFNSIIGDDYFSKFKLQNYLTLTEKKSYKLYNLLIQLDSDYLELGVDYLKELINESNNQYTRFYDFEKNIIKPIINDINHHTDLEVTYTKEHLGKTISSLKFFTNTTRQIDENIIINSFFNSFPFQFKDITSITSLIKSLLHHYSDQKLLEYFNFLSSKYKTSSDEPAIIKLLNKKAINNFLNPNLYFYKKFKSSIELFNFLYKELEKIDLGVEINQNFFPPEFLILAYSGNLTDYQFHNKYLKASIHYSTTQKSSIIITLFQ